MPQHAEAFPQEDFQPEPKKEPEKKSAVILPFRRKENPEEGNYKQYKGLGGILNPKEYEDVLKLAKERKEVPSGSLSSGAANSMARVAGIALSPEIAIIYGILSDKRPDLAKEHEEMNDQKLLAEALCIAGNESSLVTFKESLRLKKDLLQAFFIKNKTAK